MKRRTYGSVVPGEFANEKALTTMADIIKRTKIHLDDDHDFCLESLHYVNGELIVEVTDDHKGDEYDQDYIDFLKGMKE